MSKDHNVTLEPLVGQAISSLQALILDRYPTASFATFQGEDPEGTYLRAAVDVDDPDEVMDLAIDRLLEYQLDKSLPVYLLPVRTDERIAAATSRRGASRSPQTQAYSGPST